MGDAMTSKRRVAHPEWLAKNNYPYSLKLYQRGLIPEVLEVKMLIVPIQHALRSILGVNNMRVALILLWWGIVEWLSTLWFDACVALHFGEAYRIHKEVSEAMGDKP